MAVSAANKKKWNQLVDRLQQQADLTDEEVITLKEWGVALLVTGVSVWILYRIVRRIFGSSKKVVVKKVVVRKDKSPEGPQTNDREADKQSDRKRKSTGRSSYGSPWFPLIRRYAGPLLIALAQRQVNSYLRANKIVR
ncbi:MAG: hypothetical protein WA958_16380 [Tunicatimonas sp.]